MTPFIRFNNFIDKMYLPYVSRNFQKSTYDNYSYVLKAIRMHFGNTRLGFIRRKHIVTFLEKLQERDISKNTIHSYIKILNAILNYAVKNKHIFRNPCKGISVKSGKTRAGTFTEEEIKTLLNYIEKEYSLIYLPVYLSVNTGMRRGEVLGLKWENVSFPKNEILVSNNLIRTCKSQIYLKEPKTTAGFRTIAISEEVAQELRKTKEENKSEYVVVGWDGKYMDPQYLTNNFSKAVNGSGVTKRRFHDLRHTHASFLLAAGVSIKLISARLGHSDIETTLRIYSHLLPNQQHEAAEKLSEMLKLR